MLRTTFLVWITLGQYTSALPRTMRQVRATGSCAAPFTNCVTVDAAALVPTTKAGECIIKVHGSSVNPSDVDTVEFGGCTSGCGGGTCPHLQCTAYSES